MVSKTYLQAGELSSAYSFDPLLIDFNNTNPILKLNRPVDLTYLAHYSTGIDAEYSRDNGSLVGIGHGGIGVTNDELILDIGRWVDYLGPNNSDTVIQKGCVRYYWRPAYSGSPSQIQYLFTNSNNPSDYKNIIQLSHNTNGNLEVHIFDNARNLIVFLAAAYSPIANQIYEIEIDFDIDTGISHSIQNLFIDGVIVASGAFSGTRDNDTQLIRIGNAWPGNLPNCTGTVPAFLIFDQMQHTSNYTPSPFNEYPTSSPSIQAVLPISGSKLISFSFAANEETGTFISFNFLIDGTLFWFDGYDWVVSSGVSESNTSVSIDEFEALILEGTPDIIIIMYFNSTGTDTPQLFSYTINYNGFGEAIINGSFLNRDETPVVDGYVMVAPTTLDNPEGANVQVGTEPEKIDIDIYTGEWTTSILITGMFYDFEFFTIKDGFPFSYGLWRAFLDKTGNVEFDSLTRERIDK